MVSYNPIIPHKSELIVTGNPNPNRMGATDSLKSILLDAPWHKLRMGLISKQVFLHLGSTCTCWSIFSPFDILSVPLLIASSILVLEWLLEFPAW
jgi:hypothetical protein